MSEVALPHILVLGGSGRTGKLVIEEAIHRGHSVTALVRKPDSLLQQPNLNAVTGSPTESADIDRALAEISASIPIVIISTLGQTRTSGNPFAATTSPPRFMAASAEAVINTIKASSNAANVRKFVAMSVFGAKESFQNLNFLMRWIMQHSNMQQTIEDHNLVDEIVKDSGLPFVLARSVMLKGEDAAEINFSGENGEAAAFMPSISAKSVAGFLLDAAVKSEWDGTTPVISN